MTSIRSLVARLFDGTQAEVEGAPDANFVLAPRDAAETARLLDTASEHGLTVLPWGGGTHQGLGGRVHPDIVLSTSAMSDIVDFQPADLTVVAQGGCSVVDLEVELAADGVTAVLPEIPGPGTVGGAIAAGASPWRRLRYGPIRDRMLQTTLATGDGRVVTAGGRVVKNVTGYDIPRLSAGSLGSLGIITHACLKLWPVGETAATVVVDDPERALTTAHRPLAVIGSGATVQVYLSGTAREVEAQAATLGGEVDEGLHWLADPGGEVRGAVRIPPSLTAEALHRIPARVDTLGGFGVGEVRWGCSLDIARDLIADVRPWAESHGGAVVLSHGPDRIYDELGPWGTSPDSTDLQRRIKAAFDPLGVMVPGRLPGGV